MSQVFTEFLPRGSKGAAWVRAVREGLEIWQGRREGRFFLFCRIFLIFFDAKFSFCNFVVGFLCLFLGWWGCLERVVGCIRVSITRGVL